MLDVQYENFGFDKILCVFNMYLLFKYFLNMYELFRLSFDHLWTWIFSILHCSYSF